MRRKKRTKKRRQRKRKWKRRRRRRRKRGERIRRRITTEMRVRVKLRGRRRPGAMNYQKAVRDVRVMREVLVERTKVQFRGIVEEILVRAMKAKVVPARMAVKLMVPERRARMGVITVSRTQNPEIQLFVTHNDLFIVQAITPPTLTFLMRIS
jgi:hypothetical protein